jgi:signal transduction histidine kinase
MTPPDHYMVFISVLNKLKYTLMAVVMVAVWLAFGMVWFDRFIPPFDRLVPLLMPWKALYLIPAEASFGARLAFMQDILEASGRTASAAFATMAVSFVAFSFHATLIYNQRQRRARENELLLLKNREIARRNEFIRYISATISHEFKNNLGRIKRRLDLLPGLPQETRERIDGNMDKLFADIEIFKKISEQREAALIDFRKVGLDSMLEELARQYGDLADISIYAATQMPSIIASPALLKTVFENIIDNAVAWKKYDQPRAVIRISCGLDDDGSRTYVSLAFRDFGQGMDEQQADQCFYHKTKTPGGWGQGLLFAKYVVGMHAGKIKVGKEHTAKDSGTEFIIHLPFVEEDLHV